MSETRKRLEQLKKKKGIASDAELLRRIHKYLLRDGLTKYLDVDEFVNKTKGSFGQMVDGKNGRKFQPDFYLPLEVVLDTSMAYLLEGRGEQMPSKTPERGLRYAAATDTKGNYEKLVEEGVVSEYDEYGYTLLDYIIENDSKNGIEFFAEKDELPLDAMGCFDRFHIVQRLGLSKYTSHDLFKAVARLGSAETVLKYSDGFDFAEKGMDPQYHEERIPEIVENASLLLGRDDVRPKLCDFRKIPMSKANPHLASTRGESLGSTGFANFIFNAMLDIAFAYDVELADEVRIELLERAIEINKEIIPMILALPYEEFKIGKYGYVYCGNIICGSVACLEFDVCPSESYSLAVHEKIEELLSQLDSFYNKITESSAIAFLGGEMKLAKQDCPAFYAFYRTMKETRCGLAAVYDEDKSDDNHDFFILPNGELTPIPNNKWPKLYVHALKTLAEIDSISETVLGDGKIYHFPKINNRSFYAVDDVITGIAPTEVVVGERYDNLAEFLAWTCIFTPRFQMAGDQVSEFAKSLREYGIKKKDVKSVLKQMESYFSKSACRWDKKTERGKVQIANAYSRELWCKLFADEIEKNF